MKKIISLMLAIAMMLSCMGSIAFAADATVTIDNKSINPEETVDIYFKLSNCPELAGIMIYQITYDEEALTLVSGESQVTGLPTMINQWDDNALSVMATQKIAVSGNVLKLTFKAGTKIGTFPIGCSVRVTYEVDGKPVDGAATSGSITVLGKTFKELSLTSKAVEYNGEEQSIEVQGLPQGATVSYEGANKATNAGVYPFTATVSAPGYNDWKESATLTINKKAITVTGLKAENKTYDGNDAANLTGAVVNGKIENDAVEVTVPQTGTFATKDAGENIAVSFEPVTISGDSAANYTITQPSALTANINKVVIAVTAENAQKRVGTSDPELTYTSVGDLVGEDTFTGTLVREEGEAVGSYDINQGSLGISENYDIRFTKGTFEILDKKPQNITLDDIPAKTYGDADFNLVVTKDSTSNLENFTYVSSNENVAIVDNTGKVTIKGAGEAEISVTEAGNEDYAQKTVKKTLTVAKAPLDIKLGNISITYGEAMPEYPITYTGFVGEEDKAVLTSEPQVNGMPKKANAGEYDLTLSGAEAANYEITYSYEAAQENAKLTVEKKLLSIETMNVFDKAADETTTAAINTSSITFTGLVSGDDVKVDTSVATAAFEDAAVGDNKNVSVSNIAIIGNDANNDQLENTIFATTGNIKDSITATDIATQISAPTVEKNAEALTLPEVPKGYEIVIKSSDDEAVIGLDGKIAPMTEEKSVKLVFAIKNTADETETAETIELTVTVPVSDKVNVAVSAEANGTVTGGGEYPKNSMVTVTATANSGYNFSGWYNGETSVSESASYTFKATDDISLAAKFKKKTYSDDGGSYSAPTYTVKFDTDGGSEAASVTSTGKAISEPTAPVKDGFVFDGWYTDKELTEKYDFTSRVTKSFTLYAKWVENQAETEPTDSEPATTENPFGDVSEENWFYNAVMFAYENNITSGISETEFAPDGKVTRGQFITMLCRAYGVEEMTGDNFADCGNTWYTGYLAAAKQLGISNGVGNNKFAPEAEITREEMVVMLYNYLKSIGEAEEKTGETSFSDNDEISAWAKPAVIFASESGYVSGKGNNRFDGKGTATRAELVQIFYNIFAK